MLLRNLRRRGAPVALVTYASFLLGMTRVGPARADEQGGAGAQGVEAPAPGSVADDKGGAAPAAVRDAVEQSGGAAHAAVPRSAPADPTRPESEPTGSARPAESAAPGAAAPAENPVSQTALPTGADKTGVSSQAISVPSGAGKIQGMGESFSAQLSTGIATFNVPIALPAARGAAQPSLALSYSSGAGQGVVGMGWSIGVPFIARQTDRGMPRYEDPAPGGAWLPNQDRFVFNGGQELVPICLVGGSASAPTCAGKLDQEVMPGWASSGWQYFRPRVEGSFQRFFWSPDHRTWRVQDKSGVTMELGVPWDGPADTSALEVDPGNGAHIYRWNLSREYDAHVEQPPPSSGEARPVNLVRFQYTTVEGESYLTDIFDTTPTSNPAAAPISAWAHHTRLVYENRPDRTFSFRRGWRTASTQRLARIDVTSMPFDTTAQSVRHMVRRYLLGYDSRFHRSLLTSVQVEGRCSDDEIDAPSENGNQTLPSTNCPRLPAMKFDYQHVAGYDTQGEPQGSDLAGYEAFDERIHTLADSPDHSVDEALTDLFDVNADGLPDVLVTAPGIYGGGHGVFFNGAKGKAGSFVAGTCTVRGGDANTISLKNPNVSAQDVDGDGIADLLHMPMVKKYEVYTPQVSGTSCTWVGREITTASGQDPKIDFGKDAPDVRVMDVNGDGLVDVVYSSGTELQTFFSLGRYPNGDGQFGNAKWTGATSATISNEPVKTCLPWDSAPVRFSDKDVKLGDMNGDGLVDIVRIHRGDIRYWPGRGNGVWGTGNLDDCPGNSFGQGRNLVMSSSPRYSDIEGDSLRLEDVNGDGLDDLVQVRFDGVDVWLNEDGTSWTGRHIMAGTPASPSYANRVRLVDINGSGTRDILWGDAKSYKYIDLAGGQRPWVLTHVENGLGKTTDIEYASSTSLMIKAAADGAEWGSVAPMPIHVVTRIADSDNLELVGRPAGKYVTEYSYRDPVYDGRQREFRGFRHAESRRIGDDNSPTSITSSDFLLGECKDEILPDGTRLCAPGNRWRDHGREALKGLPYLTETRDETGVYPSTQHNTYRLVGLHTGLDGRTVRHAFARQTDTWLYDTDVEPQKDTALSKQQVTNVEGDEPQTITLRGATGRAHTVATNDVDLFGNATEKIASGCTDCTSVDEEITSYTKPGRPAGDRTGWLWRTVETSTKGSVHQDVRHHTYISYSAQGDPTDTTADLSGTVLLDRNNAAGKTPAPAPWEASGGVSGSVSITVLHEERDQFGNVNFQSGPNHRCRYIGHQESYATFATSETVRTGPVPSAPDPNGHSCGETPLTSSASYDRGLGLVLEVTDLHGEKTSVDYDAYGRLTLLTRPSPYFTGGQAPPLVPSIKIEYLLTDVTGKPYSVIHTQTQDGADYDVNEYQEAWAYVDGLTRSIVSLAEAEPMAGHPGRFIANGLTEYDNKGAARRAYVAWFYEGDPMKFPLASSPPSAYGRQRYDAFGRQVETFGLDGTVTLQTVYHALSQDKWDAADLAPGPHQGTPASVRSDGHGRPRVMTERIHVGEVIEERQTITDYLATGEIEKITRHRPGRTDQDVVRWMQYDSMGRRVLNAEPNTSKDFHASPNAPLGMMRAWRYAYNDAGDLVGTSDARGCGANYIYDPAGRLLAEDYSPCETAQEDYSPPDLTARTGVEVLYHYDDIDVGDRPANVDFPTSNELYLGRLAWVADRAAKTVTRYDGRGRVTGVARQIAKPEVPALALADRYTPRWYIRKANFDGADRPIRESTGAAVVGTGADAPGLLGAAESGLHEGSDPSVHAADNKSVVTTQYTARGTLKSVGGSYGTLVSGIDRDADGLVLQTVYGDAAGTTTGYNYDNRRRVSSVTTYRGPPAIWTGSNGYTPAPLYGGSNPPSTFQLLLEDEEFTYDEVDNPTEIHDWRLSDEWPGGAKPVTRKMQYDDLYRVTQVRYEYAAGTDAWVSPFAAENGGSIDPRRARPAPQIGFDRRVLQQAFQYDWLGNTSRTEDDAGGFYDRSLGPITNGGANSGPYQLAAASNEQTASGSTRRGHLTTRYDDAGNLTRLAVVRSGQCLPGPNCSHLFAYGWDEVGHLVEARRWDVDAAAAATLTASSELPSGATAAHLLHRYDANDARVIKTAVDDATAAQRSTLYVFASLELRRADTVAGDYSREVVTEVPYLMAHGVRLARVVFEPSEVPSVEAGKRHVFVTLGDHLGSTSIVIDNATSELVERGTTQAYGAAESDYRAARWNAFREDYRFTGKEDDIEVGLTYFGARFYAPLLGRWTKPDPLNVHGLGADLNVYGYVRGHALRAVDPVGLECDPNLSSGCTDVATPSAPSVPTEGVNVNDAQGSYSSGQAQGPSTAPSRVAPKPASSLAARGVGALQMVGGGLEVSLGAGALLVPEPTMATKVAGAVLVAHGADTTAAGARTLWTGEVNHTLTEQGATAGAEALGASPETAHAVGVGADLAAGVGPSLALGISRRLAIAGAERSAEAVSLGYLSRGGSAMGHNVVGVTQEGSTQWFHLAGDISSEGGVSFGARSAPQRGYQFINLGVSEGRAAGALATAERLVKDGAMTWSACGPNCTTTAASVLRSGGVVIPAWGASPMLLNMAVGAGAEITAVGAGSASISAAAVDP